MISNHPGPWQQYYFRSDNKGLSIMELKSKYLHEQYLFEAELLNLQQQHQQNVFMNGGGGGSTSSPSGPILKAGAKIVFTANSILDVNDDLGWNVENIENWKTNAFETVSGEITYLTVVETAPTNFEVNIGGSSGLEVRVRNNAFQNSTSINLIGPTDTIGVEEIIIAVGDFSFASSNITNFTSYKCIQVGEAAFKLTSLIRIVIGDNMSNIILNSDTFRGCSILESIGLIFSEINITGNDVFNGCINPSFNISQFGGKITNMSGVNIFKGCNLLSSVTIGSENGTFTGDIGNNCFEGCTNLNSFTLYNAEGNPGGQSIGSDVFLSCENLSSIAISNLLTLSGTGIFVGVNESGNASFKLDQNIATYDPNSNIPYLNNFPRNWSITYT